MTPIAIVGLSGLFPGAANVAAFWDNVVNKRSAIMQVPESRWRLADYYDPDPAAPDKTYCRVGGFMPDIDFDPVEFGMPPNVLEVTDVAQLLGLLLARDAFADAGYGEGLAKPFPRERTGVILGIGGGQKLITPLTSRLQSPVWEEAMRSSGISADDARAISAKARQAYVPWEENSFPGFLGNVIAGRIANRFDLGGINCVVDAACASSLAAVRMAMSELAEGQCDLILSGGIDTDNSIFMYMSFSKTPAFSKQGVIRPFDADADGMLVGEAAGLLVLKRLEDAERDGDRVYAVIRGIGASSDGRFNSIYAPRSEGQARALERAYANAGVPMSSVGLIEAHGTGTVAGDLVEITTLDRVFGREAQGSIAVGSAKSQIGHGKAAAGAVGLIKAALALHHRVLPPTINVTRPHPAGDFGDSAFYINSETRPWLRHAPEVPRRAGVSSFGFGGSNYHAVLEEHDVEQTHAYRLHQHAHPFLFAAATPAQLAAALAAAISQLRPAGDGRDGETAAGAFARLSAASAALSPAHPDARLGFVAETAEEAVELLQAAAQQLAAQPETAHWDHPRGIFYRRAVEDPAGHVVALFPGQGAQYVDMGRELAVNFPEIRSSLAAFDALLSAQERGRLSDVVLPPPRFDGSQAAADAERLRQTEFAQPAIGAISAGMFRLLARAGFRPDFVAGHSFGELTALWAAGALSDDAFCVLALARGQAMAPPAGAGFDPGSMLSVQTGEAEVAALLPELDGLAMANVNSPRQVVLAGPTAAVDGAAATLTARGLEAIKLPVAAAFHTPLVAHARDAFQAAVADATFQPARIPVFANSTGRPYPKRSRDIARMLVDQMLAPVRFADQIENMYRAGGSIFVEIGPRRILSDLVADILGSRHHQVVTLNPSRQRGADRQFREALVKLRVLGLPIDLADPYDRTIEQSKGRPSAATVKLNGANYVSPQTKQAYRDALNNGHHIQAPGPSDNGLAGAPEGTSASANTRPGVPRETLPLLAGLQAGVTEAHQQFLRDQGEQNRLRLSLLRDAASLPAASSETLRERFASLEQLQADTLQSHHLFLEEHLELIRALVGAPAVPELDAAVRPAMPAIPEPAPRPPASGSELAAPSASAEPEPAGSLMLEGPSAPEASAVHSGQLRMPALADIEDTLLELVSERTGYPRDVLDLDMDIEADLGIDSIKRVEILGAVRDRFPGAPQPQPAQLGELRTLAQIVAYLGGPVQSAAASPPALQKAPAEAAVADALLELVSQRTGYPREVLDLDMDIEADLGIDSIKRVEILGAMRQRYPDMPQPAPAQLGELRTLASVLAYLTSATPAAAPTTPSIAISGVRLQPLPPADVLDGAMPPPGLCLITDDGTGRAGQLAAALRELGADVAILEMPRSIVPEPSAPNEERRVLPAIDEDLIAGLCQGVGGFVYLHPCREAGDGLIDAWEHQSMKFAFLMAKHLAAPLRQAALSECGRPFFAAVTTVDGKLGLRDHEGAGSGFGGLFGLTKSLNVEWPGVHCRALDLAPDLDDERAVQAILDALCDPDRTAVEVGLGGSGRAVAVPAP